MELFTFVEYSSMRLVWKQNKRYVSCCEDCDRHSWIRGEKVPAVKAQSEVRVQHIVQRCSPNFSLTH